MNYNKVRQHMMWDQQLKKQSSKPTQNKQGMSQIRWVDEPSILKMIDCNSRIANDDVLLTPHSQDDTLSVSTSSSWLFCFQERRLQKQEAKSHGLLQHSNPTDWSLDKTMIFADNIRKLHTNERSCFKGIGPWLKRNCMTAAITGPWCSLTMSMASSTAINFEESCELCSRRPT